MERSNLIHVVALALALAITEMAAAAPCAPSGQQAAPEVLASATSPSSRWVACSESGHPTLMQADEVVVQLNSSCALLDSMLPACASAGSADQLLARMRSMSRPQASDSRRGSDRLAASPRGRSTTDR